MSSTASRAALERELRDAEASLSVKRGAAQAANAAVEARAAGLDATAVATDAGLSRLIATEEKAKNELAVATEKRDGLLRQISGAPMAPPINGHTPVDGFGVPAGEQRRGIQVGFSAEELDAAHAHLLGDNPPPIRLGPSLGSSMGSGMFAATETSSDWAQAQVASYDLARVWPYLREQARVAEMFLVDSIDRESRVYYRFNTPANQAAVVAENATKPQSSPQVEAFTVTPQVVAHFGAFTRQMLLNAPDFLSQFTAEFVSGLGLAVDQGLISGTGTSELHGIANAPGISTYLRDTTNEARSDAILAGITKVRTQAFVEPTHLIIHPNDLEDARKEKASDYVTSGTGLYLSNPAASLWEEGRLTSLWGLQIVATTSATEGTAIVIDPAAFGTLVMRLPVVADLDPYSLFTTNGYQLRVETMLDLACVRPKAACLVELL
jgi:HK97 family phage major capsid protein